MHWTTLATRYLLERPWLRLREDRVRLPNGTEIPEFHVLETPDWVAVLPLTEDGRVVMVEQYRHGIGRLSLELPAGVIEPREDPRSAAHRELEEETGHRANTLEPLMSVAPEPSRHTHTAHFFIGKGTHRVGEPTPDATESLSVVVLDVPALFLAIDDGTLCHGVHIAAVLLAARRGFLRPAG